MLVALCSGEPAAAPETQLALWLARQDLGWDDFVAKGGDRGRCLTFTDERVSADDAPGAARLLLRAGLDPTTARFFRDSRPAPEAAPSKAEPGTEPDLEPASP